MDTLSVCNMALSHLAMTEITQDDLDDNVIPAAKEFNKHFTQSRNEILSENAWPFCTAQAELDLIDEEYVVGWGFSYTYPAQALAIWCVYDEGTITTKEQQEYEIKYDILTSAKIINTDIEDALADYSYKVTDLDLWDVRAINTLAYRMAAKMAHALIGDPSIGLKMMDVSANLISEAKRLASNEQKKKPPQNDGYITARG